MKKYHRTIKIAYYIVVILGSFVVGILISAFDLQGSIKQFVFWGWLIFLIAAAFTIDILWSKKLFGKIASLEPILYSEPDQYIQQIHELLDGMRSTSMRQLLLINHSVALCYKKDYPEALAMLQQLQPKKLISNYRPIYWADMALIYFYLGEDDKAVDIMQKQEVVFARFKESPRLGGTLAVLNIFHLLAQKKYSQAQEALDILRPRWEDEHNIEDFEHLQKRCLEQN